MERSPSSKARARSRAQSSNACWGPVAVSDEEEETGGRHGMPENGLYAFAGSTYLPTFTRPGRMTRPRRA